MIFTCYFKMVFVSLGAPRRERKGEGVQLPASCLPAPQKDNIPMLLLLQEPHLTTLFDLLEMLASFKPPPAEVAMEDSEVTLIKILSVVKSSVGCHRSFPANVCQMRDARCVPNMCCACASNACCAGMRNAHQTHACAYTVCAKRTLRAEKAI